MHINSICYLTFYQKYSMIFTQFCLLFICTILLLFHLHIFVYFLFVQVSSFFVCTFLFIFHLLNFVYLKLNKKIKMIDIHTFNTFLFIFFGQFLYNIFSNKFYFFSFKNKHISVFLYHNDYCIN